MIRRGAVLVSAVLLIAIAMPARAAEPPGPRLAVVTFTGREGISSELITISPQGEMRQRVIVEPASDRPSWSADGNLLAVGAYGDWEGRVVAVAAADGSGFRAYRRATLEGEPVISPDGRLVAFSQARLVKVLPGRENYLYKTSIWLLDVKSGTVRRLTRWRLQTYLEPSTFSPDGAKLATTMFGRDGFKAVAIDLDTGQFSLLAREALEPTYSPDGSRFAFVRYLNWRLNGINERVPAVDELRVGRVGTVTGTKLLLRKRGFFSWPSWDPSGSRLSFTHSQADELGDRSPEVGDKVMAINADGTCLTRVLKDPEVTFYGSAWQPGPGREAGPIAC
jgi:Tol biopolymer transport system component